MTWLPPELELGEEPELKPLEPVEEELEPEELDPAEELEPVEPELVPDEPEPEEPEEEPEEPELTPEPEEPELAEDEPELDPVEEDVLVLCVGPGRARASAPAVTTLAMVTAVVADRTFDWPRSLAAMARRTLSRCALLMYPILRPRTRFRLYVTSRFAMKKKRGAVTRTPEATVPSEHEGHLKRRIGFAARQYLPTRPATP